MLDDDLHDIWILIGNNYGVMDYNNPVVPEDKVCYHFTGYFQPGETKSFRCRSSLAGNSVYILRLTPGSSGTLTVCEVTTFEGTGTIHILSFY